EPISIRLQRVGELAIIVRQVRPTLRELIERAAGTSQERFRPGAYILGRNRLRREVDDVIPAGKRELQLGHPAPDLLHPAQIGGLLIAMSGSFRGQQALFLDETVEVGARHGPGVALVLDEAVHDRNRATRPVLLKLDTSKQRRRMRERNGLRQKTADFDFRVEAALEATEELDDAVGAHQDGRVWQR